MRRLFRQKEDFIDFLRKKLCSCIARMFEEAGEEGYDPVPFVKVWLTSKHCRDFAEVNPGVIGQSPLYHKIIIPAPDFDNIKNIKLVSKGLLPEQLERDGGIF